MRARAFLYLSFLLVCVGCGDGLKRRPISGQVTFQGTPLDHGRIQFFRLEEPPLAAAGTRIENGGYSMPAELGLDPGSYRVQLDSMERDPTYRPKPGEMLSVPPSRNRLPARYYENSTITVEVTADGPNRFDFDIEDR